MFLRKYIVLVCALLLAAAAYALSFEVQVPMSSSLSAKQQGLYMTSGAKISQSSYHPSQTVINMSSTYRPAKTTSSYAPSGRFTTYVPSIDMQGHAVEPSATTIRRPRKVIGDGDEDDEYESGDPNAGSASPLGNTPYFLFGLLLIGYAAFVKRRQILKK